MAMELVQASLVRQMHEVLRGAAMPTVARKRAAAELAARIQRLRDRDARFACVRCSPDIAAVALSAKSA